ncbi:hypothetical protein ISS30_01720 [bacterium]|nr:hypothetical protein [FCB group bacterium]MBL7190384.1 hypothetical protein [bacterium]
MKRLLLIIMMMLPIIALGQGMPSEQFVLYKVWSSDSSALQQLGRGDYIFSDSDTVVLEGTDMDTIIFGIPNPKGYFCLWVIPDTANFTVDGQAHNHAIGQTDSLTVRYRPMMNSSVTAVNPLSYLSYIANLDWDAESAYYESITPPLCQYLKFYISHSGVSDTSAVILQLHWQ